MGYRGDPSRGEHPRCSRPELYLSWPLIVFCLFELRCRYQSPDEIDSRHIDDLVAAPAEDSFQHEQAEALGLLQRDCRRHREFLARHWDLDQCGTVVLKSLANHRLNLVRSVGSKS